MRDLFIFQLHTLDGGVAFDLVSYQLIGMLDILDDAKKSAIGTELWLAGGVKVSVREVREAIYKMDKFSIFKKAGQ